MRLLSDNCVRREVKLVSAQVVMLEFGLILFYVIFNTFCLINQRWIQGLRKLVHTFVFVKIYKTKFDTYGIFINSPDE